MRNGSAQRVAVSGLLTSLMLVLGLIERQFPLTAAIPGIKLGLANSVLIYALYMLGVKQSIVLMLLKAMMSWLIYTNMQAMFYSLAGGVLSLLAMIALSRIKGVSVIGVSALGAVGFNIGQILMAVAMLHTPQLIVTYLPVLMVSGVATGVLTGVVAQMVMKHLKVIEKKAYRQSPARPGIQNVDKKLFSPEGGRIALSANERIAEFLDFAIQAKFAYVNKLNPRFGRGSLYETVRGCQACVET